MKKQIWIIIVLAVLLVIAGGYIVMGKYNEWESEKDLNLFQQGSQYGYEQAVLQLMQQAATCQQVPLNVDNQTLNVIAVDCLQ